MHKSAIRAGKALFFLMLASVPFIIHGFLVHLPPGTLGSGLIVAFSGTLHTIIYLAILAGFGITLLPGHTPLITRLARISRGTLSDELTLYTRHVTWAWCVFCLAQIGGSLLLLLWAPLPIWSLFVNILNFPLILAMLAGEYGYRCLRYRHYTHETPADMVRIFMHVKAIVLRHVP